MKSEYLSIRIEPRLKGILQRRAEDNQHSLSETITEILIDRLLDEQKILVREIYAELMINE